MDMRSWDIHCMFKLALVELLDLANGVHRVVGEKKRRKLEEESEKGFHRSICGTVKSPIVYSTPTFPPLLTHPNLFVASFDLRLVLKFICIDWETVFVSTETL